MEYKCWCVSGMGEEYSLPRPSKEKGVGKYNYYGGLLRPFLRKLKGQRQLSVREVPEVNSTYPQFSLQESTPMSFVKV